MNRITDITKRDIIQLFTEGIDVYDLFLAHQKEVYPYYGRLEEIEFLQRLYDLKNMPSMDERYENALGDIHQHTVNNDDYPYGWVFTDERFPLSKGTDEEYLLFLCEVFHPEVCNAGELLNKYYDKINSLLKCDGYELYREKTISGRPLYSYRQLSNKEICNDVFVPFSERHPNKITGLKISLPLRKKIIDTISCFDSFEGFRDETGWNYNAMVSKEAFKLLLNWYEPKAYNNQGQLIAVDEYNTFLSGCSPKKVFDMIEVFYQLNKSLAFESSINETIQTIQYKLIDGKVDYLLEPITMEVPKQDDTLKGIIHQAEALRRDPASMSLALEKLWDAFERIKTYLLDEQGDKGKAKQNLINQILSVIAQGDESLKEKIDNEFRELTRIGNAYSIRHFERGQKPISDIRLQNYLYARCSALIQLTLQFIDAKEQNQI